MSNINKLLNIASDSSKMTGWHDSLSMMVGSAQDELNSMRLSDDELSMVAGGSSTDQELTDQELKEKLKAEFHLTIW